MNFQNKLNDFFYEHGIIPSMLPPLVEGRNIVPRVACQNIKDYGRLAVFVKKYEDATRYTINNMKDTCSPASFIIKNGNDEEKFFTLEERKRKRREEEFKRQETLKQEFALRQTKWKRYLEEALAGRPLNENDTGTYLGQKGVLTPALNSLTSFLVGKDARGEYVAVFFVDKIGGEIVGVQRLYSKKFSSRGNERNKDFYFKPKSFDFTYKNGSFIPLGDINSSEVIICEGLATGLSLYRDNPGALVLVAGDAGNLFNVAKKFRGKKTRVIAGDYDVSGVGQKKAEEAGRLTGAIVRLPVNSGDKSVDFNDAQSAFISDIRLSFIPTNEVGFLNAVANCLAQNPNLSVEEIEQKVNPQQFNVGGGREIISRILARRDEKLAKVEDGESLPKNSPYFLNGKMGSGKTTLVAELTKSAPNLVCVSPRISIVNYNAKKFDRPNYQETTTDPRGCVVCINSFTKVLTNGHIHTLVMDEVEQTLDTLVSGFVKDSEAIYTALTKAIRNAHNLYFLDAFLSQHTKDWVKNVTGREPVFLEAAKVDPKNKIAYVYRTENGLLKKLRDLMQEGFIIYICANTKGVAQRIYKRLKELFPDKRIILFTAEDKDGLADFTANPNSFLKEKKPDAVIVSPVISSSLSIEIDYFQAQFAFFRNGVNRASECMQQLGRVRTPLPLYICMRPGKKLNKEKAEQDAFLKVLKSCKNENKKLEKTPLPGHVRYNFEAVFKEWDDVRISREAEILVECANIYDDMLKSLKEYGWQITFCNEKTDVVESQATRRIKAALYDERKQELLAARDMTEEEEERVRADYNPQKSDIVAIERANLKKLFDITNPAEVTPEVVHTFLTSRSQIWAIKLLLSPARVARTSLKEVLDNKPISEREYPYTAARNLFRALRAVGISWKKKNNYLYLTLNKEVQGFPENSMLLHKFTISFTPDDVFTLGSLRRNKPINVVRALLKGIGIRLRKRKELYSVEEKDVEWVNYHVRWFEERSAYLNTLEVPKFDDLREVKVQEVVNELPREVNNEVPNVSGDVSGDVPKVQEVLPNVREVQEEVPNVREVEEIPSLVEEDCEISEAQEVTKWEDQTINTNCELREAEEIPSWLEEGWEIPEVTSWADPNCFDLFETQEVTKVEEIPSWVEEDYEISETQEVTKWEDQTINTNNELKEVPENKGHTFEVLKQELLSKFSKVTNKITEVTKFVFYKVLDKGQAGLDSLELLKEDRRFTLAEISRSETILNSFKLIETLPKGKIINTRMYPYGIEDPILPSCWRYCT